MSLRTSSSYHHLAGLFAALGDSVVLWITHTLGEGINAITWTFPPYGNSQAVRLRADFFHPSWQDLQDQRLFVQDVIVPQRQSALTIKGDATLGYNRPLYCRLTLAEGNPADIGPVYITLNLEMKQ